MSVFIEYLQPTAAGAYQCCNSRNNDMATRLLRRLLSMTNTPEIDLQDIGQWLGQPAARVDELLRHLKKLGWVQCHEHVHTVNAGKFEDVLPGLLKPLSSNGKCLLADAQGFYVASAGFPHETAEELSALSADLASLYDRHSALLKGNLNHGAGNWAIVDAAGFSQLGVWSLCIDNENFYLVLEGLPRFDRDEFLQLAWILHHRYASRTTVREHTGTPPSMTSSNSFSQSQSLAC